MGTLYIYVWHNVVQNYPNFQSRISCESFNSLEYTTCFQAVSHTARSFATVGIKNDWELECGSFECV